jgi:hypothetical protein
MLLPIGLLMAYFTFVHAVTIASLRYRLPLEPFLIVLAAEPLARAGQWLSKRFRCIRSRSNTFQMIDISRPLRGKGSQ